MVIINIGQKIINILGINRGTVRRGKQAADTARGVLDARGPWNCRRRRARESIAFRDLAQTQDYASREWDGEEREHPPGTS